MFTSSGPDVTTYTRGLQRLLGVVDVTSFLREQFTEEMLHSPGPPDRWSDLFSWDDLNRILNQGILAPPNIRFVKDGAEVPLSAFTFKGGSRLLPASDRCQQLMASGATLIVQNIDGFNPRLEAFARSLERDFNADVQIDVVATCAIVPGLKTHWDNAECFNLQLDGQKRWVIFRPERLYPLTATRFFPNREDITTKPAPDAPPTWSGLVVLGDLMYLPRGWWHAVAPVTIPSMHLSVSVHLPTLTDFLRWSARDTAAQSFARKVLPTWEPRAIRLSRLQELIAELKPLLSSEQLEAYINDVGASRQRRPAFSLPGSALVSGPQLRPSSRVRLQPTAPLEWLVENDVVLLTWQGRQLRFNVRVLSALTTLHGLQWCSVAELWRDTEPLLVRAFLLTLISAGLVAVSDGD